MRRNARELLYSLSRHIGTAFRPTRKLAGGHHRLHRRGKAHERRCRATGASKTTSAKTSTAIRRLVILRVSEEGYEVMSNGNKVEDEMIARVDFSRKLEASQSVLRNRVQAMFSGLSEKEKETLRKRFNMPKKES